MSRKPKFSMTDDQVGAMDCLRKGVLRKNQAFRRRTRALLLVTRDGKTRAEAAEMCEVSLRSVYKWQAALNSQGLDGLVSRKKTGRRPGLGEAELARLKEIVKAGPLEAGFDTGIWTSSMVHQIIKKEFGLSYSERHVRHLLHKAGVTVQVPKKTGQGGSGRPRKMAK